MTITPAMWQRMPWHPRAQAVAALDRDRRTRSITLPIPAPDRWLATNDHTHWRNRQAGVKTWREAAAWRARQQRLTPIRSPYAVTAVVHKPTKRLYDVDGITPSLKACIDGFKDVGLVQDDDWRHMRSMTVTAGDPGPACLVITITELDPMTTHPEGANS